MSVLKRPMAVIGFTYIAALLVLESVPIKYLPYILACAAAICLSFWAVPKLRKNKLLLFFFSSLLFASITGFANFKFNAEPIQKYENTESVVSCVIDDMPYSKNDRIYYQAKVEAVNGENVRPFRTLMSSSSPLECDFGDTILCKVQFYKPSDTHAFNYRSYLKSKGIYICAICDPNYETETYSPNKYGLRYYIIKLRHKMLDVTRKFLVEDIANVQNSIFLGEKNNIPNHIKNDFLKNGMYHLQVTSGIHISVIMMTCLWVFKKLRFGDKAAHLLTILPVLGFMVLSGMGDSSLRAAIMCVVYLLGASFSKRSDTINSVGLAVFVICLFNPESALNLGLWFSMLSVLGIALFYRPIFEWVSSHINKKALNNSFVKFALSSVIVSIAVNIASAPIAIVYSRIFSISQFFLSFVVIPISIVIIISSFALAFFGVLQFPKLALYPFAFVSGIGTKLLIEISSFFGKIPFAYVSLDYPFLRLWLGITVIVLAICLSTSKQARSVTAACLISVLTLLTGILSYQIFNFNSAKISTINCGDGVGLVISKNNHTSCVFCADQNNNTQNLESFLELSNIYDIDYFAITNPENVAEDFIGRIINNHSIKSLVLSEQESDNISIADKTPIYFDKNITSKLWNDNLIIDIVKTDNSVFCKIQIDGVNVSVVCCDKSIDFPAQCANTDILITNTPPQGINRINPKSLMLYGTGYNIFKTATHLCQGTKIYNLWYYGRLNLMVKNNNFKVGA